MASALNPARPDRVTWPYAVGVRNEDGSFEYTHFSHLGSAALFATLMTGGEQTVTLHVADLRQCIAFSSVLGWREVGSFDPALSHEVREVEAIRAAEAALS